MLLQCCNGLKAANGRTVCTYSCCVGLREVRFDNGRLSTVECQSAHYDDDYTDDDDDDADDDKYKDSTD